MSSVSSLGDYTVSLENLMRKLVIGFIFIAISNLAMAQGQIYFINESFSHLFEFKSDNASYSQTLSCGTPVVVLEKNIAWSKVQFNKNIGFVGTSSLSLKNPECFHEKYPEFYEALNIDSADLYYWGKLGGKL